MPDLEHRRPLASRQTAWAQATVRMLAKTPITPNQISFLSMVMAGIAGLAFAFSSDAAGALRIVLLLAAALFCQLRLLCNLFDGMLAVEAGRAADDGPFWNEAPDRVADTLILVGAGYGAGMPELGWAAAALAIFTAYLRAFAQSLGQPADYSGPMAKPQRMATLTIAALLCLTAPMLGLSIGFVLEAALWLIVLLAAVTCWRRGRRIRKLLRAKACQPQ
tara:strand:- start:543 stop:1202 length:660 start_codon:yes stop_codon:yes gene_type:complete